MEKINQFLRNRFGYIFWNQFLVVLLVVVVTLSSIAFLVAEYLLLCHIL
jgi:hypothetical protein